MLYIQKLILFNYLQYWKINCFSY